MTDDLAGRAPATAHRFSPHLMHAAATLYYLQDATQAEIADRLGTSRPTVSRLLSEARRQGLVTIEVAPLVDMDEGALGDRTAEALGVEVHLAPLATGLPLGPSLAPALSSALEAVGLSRGDVLLVASGRTVYEAAGAELPDLPGVVVVPTVGGQDEPEAWYQANEIARRFAASVGGRPSFLYAPSLPGPDLHATLLRDPSTAAVLDQWEQARCAVVGIGAPPGQRSSIARSIPTDAVALRAAVGDVCLRFFDADGGPVSFPGSERLIATPLSLLRRIPATIALAVGQDKVAGILAATRAGYVKQLVTDPPTAHALIAAATA